LCGISCRDCRGDRRDRCYKQGMSEFSKTSVKDSYFVLAIVTVGVAVVADSLILRAVVLAAASVVFAPAVLLRARLHECSPFRRRSGDR
jgi:hypothetical protein